MKRTIQHSARIKGFTLVELMVAIGIIGILSTIVYASFGDSRKIARDNIRKTDLKNLQVAIELFKAQNGTYPAQGCGTPGVQFAGPGTHPSWGCTAEQYIVGLIPDFIAELPIDPSREYENGVGYIYSSDGASYKLMAHDSGEIQRITSWQDDFARCPYSCGAASSCADPASQRPFLYAVYSSGAVCW